MTMDDQRDVIDFLMSPRTHGGAEVERIDTHSAVVFLAGSRALKLKRAVRFDYLDFSTVTLRRAACEAEVRINRRAAPSLYRGVLPVTRDDRGVLALAGNGTPVDWLVEMTRFDQEKLFDRLASRHALDPRLMEPLASAIASFHDGAARRPDHGGRAGMRWVIEGNDSGLAGEGNSILDRGRCGELRVHSLLQLDRCGNLLDERRERGFVRQCHGDLHLRNIVLLDGQPTLFDAVEFNDEIACIDVMYDLAFLLMDLWRRHLGHHANAVLNSYLSNTSDDTALPLLPLFLSCRAAIRAKTSVTAARLQPDTSESGRLQSLARQYLDLALTFLHPSPPLLVAVGGLSGSGKSTLARALAPAIGRAPGAVVVRSDMIRKALQGVPALQRLGPNGYTADVSNTVYRSMRELVSNVLRTGQAAIADAVFAQKSEREAIEEAAEAAGVPFVGLWLEAPPEVLEARVSGRGPDASDADSQVVRGQLRHDVGTITWHRVDAAGDPEAVAERALAATTLNGHSERTR